VIREEISENKGIFGKRLNVGDFFGSYFNIYLE
jgi:hypothetical protein